MMSYSFLGFPNKVLELTGCEWCHQSLTLGAFRCHQRLTIALTNLKLQENHIHPSAAVSTMSHKGKWINKVYYIVIYT